MPTDITGDDLLHAIFPARPLWPTPDAREDQQWNSIHFLFGDATFWAQAYEDGMARFVAAAEERESSPTKTAEQIWKQTLGALQKDYCRFFLDGPNRERLAEALKLRNSLSHNFYRRRMSLLSSPKGRDTVIQELRDAIDFFRVERDEVYWNLSLITGQPAL